MTEVEELIAECLRRSKSLADPQSRAFYARIVAMMTEQREHIERLEHEVEQMHGRYY